MPILPGGFPDFGSDPKISDLVDYMAELKKSVDYILNGNLDSANAREFGGWRITNTELIAKSLAVGMSTEETYADDIRFWAGGAYREDANFRVAKSGRMVATGARIQSRKPGGYPNVVIDPDQELFGAYMSPSNYIVMKPYDGNIYGSPVIHFSDGISTGKMYMAGGLGLMTDARTIYLQSQGGFIYLSTGGVDISSGNNKMGVSPSGIYFNGFVRSSFNISFSDIYDYGRGENLQHYLSFLEAQIDYAYSMISGLSARITKLETAPPPTTPPTGGK